MSTDSESEMDMLIRKLQYHQMIIDKLLSNKVSCNSVRASFIERKMVRFEEMVLEIPEDDEEDPNLFDVWFDAVVDLWERFLTVASASCDDEPRQTQQQQKQHHVGPGGDEAAPAPSTKGKQKRVNRETSRVTSTVASASSTRSTNISSLVSSGATSVSMVAQNVSKQPKQQPPSKARRQKQTFRNLNFRRTATGDARSTTDQDVANTVVLEPITKEALTEQLVEAFSKLTVVEQMSDLKGIQALLTLVAYSVKHVAPFRDDTELQCGLLELVLPKLPEDVVERFTERAKEEEEKSLHLLKKCLIEELTEYYNTLKEAAGEESPDNPKTCYYCKLVGHLSYECPQAKTMLCYRCWKNGHKARDCGKRCHNCGRLGHFQKYCKSKLN